MKVLKKGNPQKGWAKEFTCTGNGNGGGGCKARLLVEQDDVYITSSSSYDGSTDTFNTFTCPECSVLTDIESVPFTAQPKSKWQAKQKEKARAKLEKAREAEERARARR